jgi:hypothetical protein
MPRFGIPRSTGIDDLDHRLTGLEVGEGLGQRSEEEAAQPGIRRIATTRPDDSGWRPVHAQEMDEVDVLGHHNDVSGASGEEYLMVTRVSEAQVTERRRCHWDRR